MRGALGILCCLIAFFSRAPEAHGATRPLPVVTSFTVLSELVSEVGGDCVSVRTLVGPDADAHVYEPTPADVRAVASARVVVLNGLGFEGWITRLLDSAQFRGAVVIATTSVSARNVGGHPDPHAWQDPRNVRTYVVNIAAALAAALPENSAQIKAREVLYLQKLEDLDQTLRTEFAEIPAGRRRVITTHDAFAYFGAAYGIEFLPVQGWTTENEPSAADIARIVAQARSHGTTAVFLENISDPRMMRQLARDTGLTVGGRLHSDALAPPGQPSATYLGMIRDNADQLLGVMRHEFKQGAKLNEWPARVCETRCRRGQT
jgi:zinc/manganese transport system substrate-binding protein